MPVNIVSNYSCWQPLHKELLSKHSLINFVEGRSDMLNDDRMFPTDKINLIIMNGYTKCVWKWWGWESSHLPNILITGTWAFYLSPRDKLWIATLTHQMYPGKVQFFFVEATEEDATCKSYSYLLVHLNASMREPYRFKNRAFPNRLAYDVHFEKDVSCL